MNTPVPGRTQSLFDNISSLVGDPKYSKSRTFNGAPLNPLLSRIMGHNSGSAQRMPSSKCQRPGKEGNSQRSNCDLLKICFQMLTAWHARYVKCLSEIQFIIKATEYQICISFQTFPLFSQSVFNNAFCELSICKHLTPTTPAPFSRGFVYTN